MAEESLKAVILTGAGISAESGIQTFRGAGGLWENHRIEDVATPEAFERDPDLVHRFYNERRRRFQSEKIQPNAAHLALAEWEQARPGDVLIVTQNIDDLHERAGSKAVLHMHGKLLEARCSASGRVFPWLQDLSVNSACECCGESGTLRPNVVWFGEMPLFMDPISRALDQCSVFVAIGTSGSVYPAAGFVRQAKMRAGARTVEMNLETTEGNPFFDERILGRATVVVPEFVKNMIKKPLAC